MSENVRGHCHGSAGRLHVAPRSTRACRAGGGRSGADHSTGEPTRSPDRRHHHDRAGADGRRCGSCSRSRRQQAPAEMNFYFPDHRALCGREHLPHAAQHPDLRGAVVRDAHDWAHYLTETIGLGRRPGGGVRLPPLAHLGSRARRRVPRPPARHVPLPARPDAAADQPGLRGVRDRRGAGDAAGAGRGLAHPRLLRLGQPQREGHLPALPRQVRGQPRPPLAPSSGGRGRALRRRHGRADAAVAVARKAYDDGDHRWAVEVLDHVLFADDSHAAAGPCRPTPWSSFAAGERHLAQSRTWAPPSCATAASGPHDRRP